MCGILGVIGDKEASRQVAVGLALLQHRGQDATGLVSFQGHASQAVRGLGLVESVVTQTSLAELAGDAALGHVRYATSGRSHLDAVQPLVTAAPTALALVHNGNLINHLSLADTRDAAATSDSAVLAQRLATALAEHAPHFTQANVSAAVAQVMQQLVGSYSVIAMLPGWGMMAFRDPAGIRPLVHARRPMADHGVAHLFASETTVASFLDYGDVVDVPAGELWIARLDGSLHKHRLAPATPRPCMFEWVYFASPHSTWEGAPVYQTRLQLGRALAEPVQAAIAAGRMTPDLVVPVPETARAAAVALAEAVQLPYRELLLRNGDGLRTFLLDSQVKREQAVLLKLTAVASALQGKRVLLVDDSIVRGTVSRALVDLVRRAGAAGVYVVSTAPPVRHPCYYGIDLPVRTELIAADKTEAEVCAELGADAVVYQTIEALVGAIHTVRGSVGESWQPCVGCLNGCYPTSVDGIDEVVGARLESRS